jgi:trehalose 2-sulfotransferase
MMQQRLSYLICATQRSGSNLLCEILRGTGLAGNPKEYFFEGFQSSWFEVFGVNSFSDYLQSVVKATATDNGVFGAKIMADHFWHFIDKTRQTPPYQAQDIAPAELLVSLFPGLHYIWLTRRDRIRQAVSYIKATQSDIWHSWEILRRPEKKLSYNAKAIRASVQYLIWQDALWQDYFAQAGIVPLTLVYEDFSQRPRETAEQIIDYLGITKAANWTMDQIKIGEKLGDATSEEWVKRYRQHEGYPINFAQRTSQLPNGNSQSDQRIDKIGSTPLLEKTIEQPLRSSPIYNHTFIEQQQFLNSLSGEDIARRIPLRKIIESLRFKVTSKLRRIDSTN